MAAHQAPLSLGFSRQEHLPFPSLMHESEKWKWSQLCLTLSDRMGCSLPGSSTHGIFQARVLEWVAIAFSEYTVYICHSFSSKELVSFNFLAAVTVCSDFGAQENKVCHYFHFLPPSICHEMMGPDGMISMFCMLSFKPGFSLSSFTIKRLFSSSLFSAIRVMSSAYLRLLVFLLAILIPACASASLAFHKLYSVYKLNVRTS